jgi:hypothetical protein
MEWPGPPRWEAGDQPPEPWDGPRQASTFIVFLSYKVVAWRVQWRFVNYADNIASNGLFYIKHGYGVEVNRRGPL